MIHDWELRSFRYVEFLFRPVACIARLARSRRQAGPDLARHLLEVILSKFHIEGGCDILHFLRRSFCTVYHYLHHFGVVSLCALVAACFYRHCVSLFVKEKRSGKVEAVKIRMDLRENARKWTWTSLLHALSRRNDTHLRYARSGSQRSNKDAEFVRKNSLLGA